MTNKRAQKERPVPHHAVDSLHELLRLVTQTRDAWNKRSPDWRDPWFRGQEDEGYSLVPGLYRDVYPNANSDDEDAIRIDFEAKSYPYLDPQRMRARTSWEHYALMQHYGLPTRLLDWSESLMVASCFAVARAMRPGEIKTGAAVWMLDPFWFNRQTCGEAYLGYEDQPRTKRFLRPPDEEYQLPRLPLAVCLPHNSPRISAQQGLFTVHGSSRKPLEQLVPNARLSRLVKFVIPKEHVRTVQRELRLAGITASTLFPDLEGLCKHIASDWMDRSDNGISIGSSTIAARTNRRHLRG